MAGSRVILVPSVFVASWTCILTSAIVEAQSSDGRLRKDTAIVIGTAFAGSLLMTSCFLCLLCWLYIWRYPHAASPLQLAIFNAENSVLISAEQGHAKGEPQELTPDMVEHFQQPCAVFSQVLLQGIQQDQLTGQGFLAVQMQPGTYVGSPAADHKTKLLLLELQPQLVALACLQPTGAQIMAGSSIALKDGTQLQVIRSLDQMHMAQASSGCAYLKHENALVIWNTDISLLALRVPMVHAALSAEKGFASVIDANVAAVKNGGGCTSVAGTSAALEQSRQRSRRRRLLGTASSLLAAACACFIVMGVTIAEKPQASLTVKALNITGVLWSDEFDTKAATSTGVNADNWSFQLGDGSAYGLVGWGNDELEYYTDAASNVIVTTLEGEGVLQITALKGAAGDAHLYTSARLVTQGLHSVTPKNGSAGIRVAVRALLPPGGAGIWPAIWMLPVSSVYGAWPASGEIDIVEQTSSLKIQSTVWYGASYPSTTHQYGQTSANHTFHVYAVDWTLQGLTFSVDENVFYSIQPQTNTTSGYYTIPSTSNVTIDAEGAPFDQPFYILMNLAVGGTFSGNPTSDTVFPQSLYVDYVRVYQL